TSFSPRIACGKLLRGFFLRFLALFALCLLLQLPPCRATLVALLEMIKLVGFKHAHATGEIPDGVKWQMLWVLFHKIRRAQLCLGDHSDLHACFLLCLRSLSH